MICIDCGIEFDDIDAQECPVCNYGPNCPECADQHLCPDLDADPDFEDLYDGIL